MENQFEQELKESLYIHRPLPLHRERGLESKFPRKRVLARHPLQGVPKADGTALLEECPGLLRMTASLRSGLPQRRGLLQFRYGAAGFSF